jgi:ABC-type antimicrobial peptide transport system permease subunit
VFDQKYSSAFEIVGVVADAKYTTPRQELRTMYFRPVTQEMTGLTEANAMQAENRSLYINSVTLHFQRQPQNLDAMVRRTLANINPNLTVIDLKSLDYQVAGNFTQERLVARLTMLFGLLALVLASVGLYGITSYQVARRTSEIGLRMALGADRRNVVRMMMRGAFLQAGLGLVIGIPVAIFGARYMADQLYQVRSYDPLSLLTAVVVLLLSATVAGFIPARRAANIDPMTALRTE